jgi:hypothetical protein
MIKTVKRKTIKQKGFKELVKILDSVFSEYIRLSNVDDNGYCRCITCGKIHHYKDIHNGHFISRSVFATRFDEMNCHPQCCYCNSYRSGEWLVYEDKLIEIYGKEKVEELKLKARMGGRPTNDQLVGMIEGYRTQIRELKKEKGL